MSGINYMTQESYDRLSKELDILKTDGRQEVSAAIAEARDKGDLSENAEYDAAKDAQGLLEARINEMDKALAYARIIDENTIDTSKVTVLTKVTMLNKKMNKEVTYKLVSESEANLKDKKISVTSPIGSGILGKKVGEIATVTTPAGTMEFEIISITV